SQERHIMSVDYTRTTEGDAPQDSDSSMFAPTPIWDRGKKGRATRRSMFQDSPTAADAAVTGAAVGGATGGLAGGAMTEEAARQTAMSPNGDDAPFVTTRTTTVRRRGSVAPAAIGVGLVALAALAVAGWYATRPADQTLTPGGTTTASTSTTSLAANTAPAGGANLAVTPP